MEDSSDGYGGICGIRRGLVARQQSPTLERAKAPCLDFAASSPFGGPPDLAWFTAT
jgi:hypothetical protein